MPWQQFVLSFSKAQRSRFPHWKASSSLEPQLIKCIFKLPMMHRDSWEVQLAASSSTYLEGHFSEPHPQIQIKTGSKSNHPLDLPGRRGPLAQALSPLKHFTEYRFQLLLQARHTQNLFPPLQRWSWGNRSYWRSLRKSWFAGKAERGVHTEKSGRQGVRRGMCREVREVACSVRLDPSPHPLQRQGIGLRQPPFTSQQDDFNSFFSLTLSFQARW